MTADDQRFSLREAADLTDKSVDTLRRRVKSGKLPGAGADEADPTGTIFIPASALIAAGLLRPEQRPEQLAQGAGGSPRPPRVPECAREPLSTSLGSGSQSRSEPTAVREGRRSTAWGAVPTSRGVSTRRAIHARPASSALVPDAAGVRRASRSSRRSSRGRSRRRREPVGQPGVGPLRGAQ